MKLSARSHTMQSMSTELALLSWWVTANVRMLGVTVVVVGLFVGVVEYTGRVAPTRRVLAAFAGSRASCCSRVSFRRWGCVTVTKFGRIE